MADRQRIPLPFGGGIDRLSGPAVVTPASFRDLRNVTLTEGWTSARLGLLRRLVFDLSDATHIIGISKVRSQGVSVVVTYNSADNTCAAWVAPGTLDTLDPLGTFWTIGGGARTPPIVSLADSYDRLFIAHDEPSFADRQATQIVDIPGVGITNLSPGGVVGTPKFRLVYRWLNYLIGAGWGTAADGDRPEIVRVSIAGDPIAWDPNHYFAVGQRGDPVIGLAEAGSVLAARKLTESYDISGYSQATFGVKPGDREFGQAGSRLSVTVNTVSYFWSLEGPRASDGAGPSRDLSPYLALAGPPPAALAANLDYDLGFAVYQPVTREVRFIFGAWAFVLHLADESRKRWSYAEYAVPLRCGGTVFDSDQALGPAETVFAVMTDGVSPDNQTIVQHAEITAVGDLLGGEVAEWWLFDPTSPSWGRYATVPVTGGALTYTYTGLASNVVYTAAVRIKRNGLAGHAYSSSIVDDWPATSRNNVLTAT